MDRLAFLADLRHGMDPMRAMILRAPRTELVLESSTPPRLGPGEIRIAVSACGVCRTDLHVLDGELAEPKLPLVLGHEIVGRVVEIGEGVTTVREGERVGVPWLGWTCGRCRYCESGRENLCDRARFTGYHRDGGYAESCIADARYVFSLPGPIDDARAAPLLCAGLIGYRTLRMAGDAERVGIYGFGAAAHLVAQIARFEGRKVFAFTRPRDEAAQALARSLGAVWAGASGETPPEPLDAALLFAPVGSLVPEALSHLSKGGVVVCGGIHMSDVPSFPYALLWGERVLRSVANLTRRDGLEFLDLAARANVRPEVEIFPLEAANEALAALREGRVNGAAVLVPGAPTSPASSP